MTKYREEIERDEAEVDLFAMAMKDKLWVAHNKGRAGWRETDVKQLAQDAFNHLLKNNDGNLVDVANFCMFLHTLDGGAQALHDIIAENMDGG